MKSKYLTILTVLALSVTFTSTASAKTKQKAADGEICTIVGTDGKDKLKGTGGNDVICGLGGNDTIDGAGGNDTIDGGSGKDSITGGKGNDVLLGESGNDNIDGNAGNDVLIGGTGDDQIDGGTGFNLCTYDPKDTESTLCNDSHAEFVSVGLTISVALSNNKLIYSGSNSGSKPLYLQQQTDVYRYNGEGVCGGGGDLPIIGAHKQFRVVLDASDCQVANSFAVITVTVRKTFPAIYQFDVCESCSNDDSNVEKNLPIRMDSDVEVTETSISYRCVNVSITSTQKSGFITIRGEVFDDSEKVVGYLMEDSEGEVTANTPTDLCLTSSVPLAGKTYRIDLAHVEARPTT